MESGEEEKEEMQGRRAGRGEGWTKTSPFYEFIEAPLHGIICFHPLRERERERERESHH